MAFDYEYLKKKAKKKDEEEYQKLVEDYNRRQGISTRKSTSTYKSSDSDDNNSWFKKSSYFDDGYDFGDVSKTLLQSVVDVGENVFAGSLGGGENLVDALTTVGAILNRQQVNKEAQNMMMYNALTDKKVDGVYESYQKMQNTMENEASEFVKKDLYDEEAIAKKLITENIENAFDVDIEANSVFGEKADSLAQSGGQLLTTAGLQAVGVPWWLTTGVTTFGAEAENALNQGATIDEATFSGLVSAGAEILTEKITGGIKFGGKTLDDALTKRLAANVSNKALRTLFKFGMDTVGEGNEEILSGLMSAIGQKLTYADDKELNELFSSEDAWDSFIGGAVLGGFSSAKNVVKGKVNGVDTVTGLTKNEQAVFDKVYKDTIAEREKGGEKLTAKEKTKIYDDVLNKLEKGYINTDTIESVLGGDTYKQYQAEVDNEKALQDEFNTLNKMKQGDMTGEQQDRRNELKEQLKAIKEGTTISDLKSKLSTEVSELAKNSRLAESYNEKSRKSQAFEADLSKYDEKQRSAVKRAIDSGILNNTNRTHEFVDLIAKLEADKGVLFDFTNNEKLKGSMFTIEGKEVAGYVQGKNIAINIDSSKALNTVVGHEITHILEGTELYPALQDAVKIFAESKGEYNSKLQSITKMYEGIEDANIEKELTAELVGEYLLSDTEFIMNLSVEQPGLFQKIYDEVKYLCKVATTRSKEARELEKVKKTFAEVYRQKNNTVTDNGVKYQVSDSLSNNGVVEKITKDMSNEERATVLRKKNIKNVALATKVSNEITEKIENMSSWEDIDKLSGKEKRTLIQKIAKEFGVFKEYNNSDVNLSFNFSNNNYQESYGKQKKNFQSFAKMFSVFDQVIESAVGVEIHNRNEDGYKPDATLKDVYVLVSAFEDGDSIVPVKLEVKEFKDKNNTLYVAVSLDTIKKTEVSGQGNTNDGVTQNSRSVNISISDLLKKINPKDVDFLKYIPNELLIDEQIKSKTDFEYNRAVKNNDLSKAQKLVDDAAERAGYKIKAFHGSDKFFTVFDKGNKTSQAPEGSHFFTSNKSVAHSYTGYKKDVNLDVNTYPIYKQATREGKIEENRVTHGGVYSVFLKMNNPYVIDFNGEYYSRRIDGMDINEIVRFAQKNNYDGVIAKNIKDPGDMGDENWNDENSRVVADDYIVFESTHVKSADTVTYDENGKVIPLSERFNEENKDIRYSLNGNTEDIAPEMNNNIYGEDVKLKLDDVPIRETTSAETADNNAIEVPDITVDDMEFTVLDDDANVLAETNDNSNEKSNDFVDSENKQETKLTRKALHSNIIEGFKNAFVKEGIDLDETLNTGKRHSALFNNDNTPQRVLEKTFGTKAGKILADLTVNKIAQNETEGIKWLNSITGKKGLLRKLSKEYNIKPGSKESAAAQMYLEGFYVNESDEYVRYGDVELAADFPDRNVRENIRLFAKDPRVREFYDVSLNAINEARVRNAYDPIPRRDNYALHFRAMDDAFSRLGVPLNPNDIKAKDLPTDLNGVTVDLKPGQPYFASAKHRIGVKTTYDLLGGMERYANSAKNQIYHIDDIQNLRALRNYIADTFGQAKGLEGIDELTADQAKERIEQVYSGHLSNFAMWLNEEANHVAGKTALMDRAVEGMFGRRGLQFLSKLNGMVGSNQVGLNISSSLTNIIPVVQTFARTNKYDFAKAFSQTVLNTARRFSGNDDGFAEKSPVMIRRKGAESFAITPYQKATDAGYAFMSAVDGVATELIARTKFNEYTRKGMSEQKAHIETDKWVSRLMGDRSLGQQPLLYNSKTLGLFTKYQLEVRNQLDSMFYDTIQETKEKHENIESNLVRNAKTAAKYTATLFELAVAQHFFGTAFESMAGYNPAFDIIEVILTACGYDDDEDSEDTTLDNLEQAFFELLGDLPYSSLITGGGRIPISSALPIQEVIMGKDQNGYDLSREERGLKALEALPYYLLPTGYGQIKKTIQGLSMFDDDLPIAGSYTDSGNLRFTVDETMGEMLRAGLFGQYANKNARDYFDNDRAPLKEKQIEEFIELDIPIQDYWEYREGLSDLGQYATLNEKGDYIGNLDLPVEKKNILINNIADRDTPIDLTDFDKYQDFEEFDFATRYPEKYAVLQEQGISVKEYNDKYKETTFMYTDDFSWAANNPESYVLSKAVTDDVMMYKKYTSDLYAIKADKDSNGKSISGSAKNKKLEYINNLDIDFGAKLILFKSQYKSDDRYNYEIIDYLNSRDDISRDEMITILEELDFIVDNDGNISWK